MWKYCVQVLNSEWIAMDPRLLELSPAEQQAVKLAAQEKRTRWDEAESKGKSVEGSSKKV